MTPTVYLPKLTVPCTPFLLPYLIGDDLRYACYGFCVRLTVVQAGALLALSFATNVSQTYKELELKRSIMIQRVRHIHFYISNWGVRFDDHAFRIFCSGCIGCRDAINVVPCL